jgi:molybdopterin synthase catalytic subunit
MARLTKQVIDLVKVLAGVQEPTSGGTTLFIGTVRDNSEAGEVDLIRYQAYEPMAEKRLLEIEEETKRLWPMARVKLVHRLGELTVGEVSVAVAVSAPHRAEAFEACRYIIERIKRDVPIWKKERLTGGREVWVEGHPIGSKARGRAHK